MMTRHPDLSHAATRLAKLLPLLSSDKNGEVVATAAAIGRTLAAAGLTWHDLAAAVTGPLPAPAPQPAARGCTPSHRGMADAISRCADLTDWESGFVASIRDQLARGRRLSAKQVEVLARIYRDRIGGAS